MRPRHPRTLPSGPVARIAGALVALAAFAPDARAAAPQARSMQPDAPRGGTTVDPEMQRAAARILDSSRAPGGAIVVSDVRTGRILVWASRGEVDYVKEPVAPSASLFKVVTAAALLEGGHERGRCLSPTDRAERAAVPVASAGRPSSPPDLRR